MPEANRAAGIGASDAHIVGGKPRLASGRAGSAAPPTPLVDWEQALAFLAATRPGWGEERLVMAVFPPDENRPCIHLPGDLGPAHRSEIERTLRRHPEHSLGLVVNPAAAMPDGWGSRPEEQRKDGSPRAWGASNRHIRGAVGVFAEGDGGLPIEEQEALAARAGLPLPTMTVWSGGKSLHQYWLLKGGELLAPDRFRTLQQGLATKIEEANPGAGIDRSLCNPARLMRAPGGRHPKTGSRCTIHSQGGPRYSVAELERILATVTSSSNPSPSMPAPSAGGSAWFDRLTPEWQRELAAAMLRFVPLRTREGEGLYEPSLKILAGLVHQFGAEDAAGVCAAAGWSSAAWDPAAKVSTIGASDHQAGIGSLIAAARSGGWRHPLDEKDRELLAGFDASQPLPVSVFEGDPAAPPSKRAPATFDERWQELERKADVLAASSKTSVRLAAEMAAAAAELELRLLQRRDLEHLLDAAARRLRPTADPVAPGGRFRVNPSLWVAEGLVRHGLNLLVGQSGAGKTRLAVALAAAWLRGDPTWLGMELSGPAIEERHLLILGTDQSREDWALAMLPVGLCSDLGDGERQLHPRITLHPLESGTVLDADGLAMVRHWCDEHPGGMVLADSLAQLLPAGIDEDKAGAARPVHALQEALGSCWGLLLHHTRKAAGREGNLGVGAGRGSGAIDAAVSRVIGLGLLHKMEHGVNVPQESDPRRELLSTKRGGAAVHIVVSSDSSGAWMNEGSAADLKTAERKERALANLTDHQQTVLAALDGQAGLLTTRLVFEATGKDWEADRGEGGKGAALLRKTLRRLEQLGLVESHLAGNERTYRLAGAEPAAPAHTATEGVEEEPYESPERLADLREERIPQAVREERDANRLWEAQHRCRTEKEGELLEQQVAEENPLLPAIGELVEISNGSGGWDAGYRVTGATEKAITLVSERSGRKLTKTPCRQRPPWRRGSDHQQQLRLAG
jgi:hypothetical protein